ncbi:MAG: DUF4129 domain-containing protein [Candidatus Kapaibacterium sp.]
MNLMIMKHAGFRVAITAVLIFLFAHVLPADTTDQITDIPIDSSKIEIKSPDINKLEQHKAELRDNYFGEPLEEDLIEKLKKEFMLWLQRFFFGKGRTVWDILGLMVVIAVIILIIYLIASGKVPWILKHKELPGGKTIAGDIQDIKKTNLNSLLKQALEEQNYREAVRYRFLIVLKQLNQDGHIEWMPDKTNTEYLKEIKDPALKDSFGKICYVFEHVWYGGFSVSGEIYLRIDRELQLPELREDTA